MNHKPHTLNISARPPPYPPPQVGNDDKFLRAIGLNHGAMVYLKYSVAREPTPTLAAAHRSDLQGRKMTVEGMIALQTRIERQETPHCASVSFDAHAANAFQAYVSGTLGFSQMRFGWMYGTVRRGLCSTVHGSRLRIEGSGLGSRVQS